MGVCRPFLSYINFGYMLYLGFKKFDSKLLGHIMISYHIGIIYWMPMCALSENA